MSLDALRSRLKAEPRDPELLAELHRRFKAVGRMDAARCAAATARYLKRSIKVEADPPAPLVLEHPGVEGVPVPRWLPGHWAQMTRALHPKLTPILSTLLDADRLSQGFQQRGKKVVPANAPPSRLEVFRSARWLADALYGDSVVLSQTSSGNKTIDFSPCALDGSEVGARLFAYPLKGRTFVLARHLAYHHASLRPRVDLTANSSLIQLFSRCVDEASKALLTQATPLRPTTNSTPPVPRATMASLKALVREHPNLNADLDRWREAADRVALDVAFTFIGDLGLAHLMLDVPFGLSSSLSSGDLSTELVRFSVSEEYFSL